MRELLFRGKSNLGEWVFSHSIYILYYKEKINLLEMVDEKTDLKIIKRKYNIYPETVGQWTGLVDVKGNKIFEGDIVKRIVANENGLVVWDDKRCGFYIKLLSKRAIGMCFPYYKMNANKLEIIGNRYDNKELLERSNT